MFAIGRKNSRNSSVMSSWFGLSERRPERIGTSLAEWKVGWAVASRAAVVGAVMVDLVARTPEAMELTAEGSTAMEVDLEGKRPASQREGEEAIDLRNMTNTTKAL